MVRPPIVTTSLLKQLVTVAAILGVSLYIGWQVLQLAGNPQLHIEFPVENQVVYGEELTIVGSATPGSEVRIDGQPVLTGDDGSFYFEVVLSEGVHSFLITAQSSLGRTTSIERTVVIEADGD